MSIKALMSVATVNMSSKGLIIGLRLAVLFIAAHFVTPEQFSDLAYSLAVIELMRAFFDLGLDAYSSYAFGRAPDESTRIQSMSVVGFAKLGLAALAYLIVFIYATSFTGDRKMLLLLGGGLLFTHPLINLNMSFSQSKLVQHQLLLPIGMVILGSLGLVLFVAQRHPSLEVWLGLIVLNELGIVVICSAITWISIRHYWKKINVKKVFNLLRDAIPIGVTVMVSAVATRIDVFVVEHISTPQELGIYTFAVRINEPFLFATGGLAVTITILVGRHLAGIGNHVVSVPACLGVSLVGGVLSAMLIIMIGTFIVPTFFPAYVNSIEILSVLAIATCSKTITSGIAGVLIARGDFLVVRNAALIYFLFICALVLSLVSTYGVVGAAYAVLLADLMALVYQAVGLYWQMNRMSRR